MYIPPFYFLLAAVLQVLSFLVFLIPFFHFIFILDYSIIFTFLSHDIGFIIHVILVSICNF